MDFAFGCEPGGQPRNEDAARVSAEHGVFVVCDGLGPQGKGGEEASRIAAEGVIAWAAREAALLELARTNRTRTNRERVELSLDSALQAISGSIFQAAAKGFPGMCTTIDVLVLLGAHALVGHVGSGRAYLLRHGELHQLTEDHTQLAHLRRAGRLAEVPRGQEAAYSKRLMRVVGFREEVQADFLAVELEPRDRFLLVTDGVWLPLGEEKMEAALSKGGPASEHLQSLHAAVAEAKGRDNFTSIVLDPPPPPEAGAEQKIRMLGNVPAFQYLGYQELIRVVNTSELVKVPTGKTVWSEGDSGDEMMLILAGSLDVIKSGRKVSALGKGDVVGEMSMIDSAPRSATVASTAPTNLLAFPRDALFALFREEPQLAVKFLWGVTMEMNKRLRRVSNQLVGLPEADGAAGGRQGPLPFERTLG